MKTMILVLTIMSLVSCATYIPIVPNKNEIKNGTNEYIKKYSIHYENSFFTTRLLQDTNEFSIYYLPEIYKNTSSNALNSFVWNDIFKTAGVLTCIAGGGILLYKLPRQNIEPQSIYDTWFWVGISGVFIGNIFNYIASGFVEKSTHEYNNWLSNTVKIGISYYKDETYFLLSYKY